MHHTVQAPTGPSLQQPRIRRASSLAHIVAAMMTGSVVMQQSRVLGGAQLPQQRPSAARPAGRSSAVRTVAMAKRKVNTFDEAWKKVRQGCKPTA
jgi:hypothetical protein